MLVLLVALALGSAPANVPEPVLPKALAELLEPGPRPDLKDVQQRLQQAETEATPQERALLQRLDALLPRIAKARTGEDPVAVLNALDDILGDAAKLYASNENFQLQVLGTRFSIAANWDENHDDGRFAREAKAALVELPKRFPRSARVHLFRASYANQIGLSELDRMRELATCLKLDPTQTGCRRSLDAQIAAYRAPRCEHEQIAPGLAMFAEDPAGTREVKDSEGAPVRIAATPAFGSKDVLELQLAPGSQDCTLVLEPDAADRFAAFTQKLVGSRVAMMLGDQVLMVPRVNERIPGGRLRYAAGKGGPGCERLCGGNPSSRALPPDLAALAK